LCNRPASLWTAKNFSFASEKQRNILLIKQLRSRHGVRFLHFFSIKPVFFACQKRNAVVYIKTKRLLVIPSVLLRTIQASWDFLASPFGGGFPQANGGAGKFVLFFLIAAACSGWVQR
jgi:hypothetical protein